DRLKEFTAWGVLIIPPTIFYEVFKQKRQKEQPQSMTLRVFRSRFERMFDTISRNGMKIAFSCLTTLFTASLSWGVEVELTCQTRDPETGKLILAPERVDSSKIGVVAVDVWNFHWC